MDMLAVGWGQAIITFLFVITCILLILVVLLQKGRGGGLAGAFGGAGGYSAFGAKTGDVFTWITVGLTGMFVLMAVLGNYAFVPSPTESPKPPVVQPENGAQPTQPAA
ncbi:MAG TPA: preprotein translocase subunit SecG [Phycisphaerae bacterium]|jgi:preprotein translocase subunit SecG|nr:preprotein translocase subunit SecG [Phycisphaerae bacterium]HOB76085.1 preprotein translocase subunit SecG [Phycisphaerae bacterium]HOJ55453.1 preprotein translocase subunit SecG [Phycisphaerae bacterium]HOL25682.1 preprotein translocase subunit SecG [Phycisphaerae bacterium]HPP19625.1 preprotein translocase subunit SecG [Phycisphaerae bacterium]